MVRLPRTAPPKLTPLALAFTLSAVSALPLVAADPPPPSNVDIDKFLAVTGELTDSDRADELCSIQSEEGDTETTSETLVADIARALEASPVVAPALRRHSVSARRYTEVALQVFAGMLGLEIADMLDQSAREQGKAAENRTSLLARSAEARAAAPRQAELRDAMKSLGEVCGNGGDDGDRDDEGDDG